MNCYSLIRGALFVACVAAGILPAWRAEAAPAGVTPDEIKKIEAAVPTKATVPPAHPHRILVFDLTEGFHHDSIPVADAALEIMGKTTGVYSTTVSEDMGMFSPEKLKPFCAVVLNNTTQLKFKDPAQRKALLDFVKGGKGLVGFHSATDNFPTWPEGQQLIGATFAGHPWGHIPIKLDDPTNPLLEAFHGKGFWINDEIYKFGKPYSREKLRVLLSMDMSRMKDKKECRPDCDQAVAWIQQVGKGRVFYCSLGHVHQIFYNPVILKFYLDGIQYALGDLKADATPSAKLSPQPKPALAPPEK